MYGILKIYPLNTSSAFQILQKFLEELEYQGN